MTQEEWLSLRVGSLIRSSTIWKDTESYGLVTHVEVSPLTRAIDWMEVRWSEGKTVLRGGTLVGVGTMRHTFWGFVDKPVEVIGEAVGAVNG
jgi:hypothetical protein